MMIHNITPFCRLQLAVETLKNTQLIGQFSVPKVVKETIKINFGDLCKFSYPLALQLWRLLFNLIGCFIKMSVKTFQPLIVIYRMSNFVYH